MSAVLHPVGPEPEETYWLRRAMVAGAVLLLVILVVALLVNSAGTGSAVAAPATPTPIPPATQPAQKPVADPSTSAGSPSPTGAASSDPAEPYATPPLAPPTATPTAAEPSGEPTATTGPSSKPTTEPSGKRTATTEPSSKPTAEPSGKPTAEPTAEPSGKPTAKPAGPVACAPSKLRATLTGDQRLKAGAKTTFRLSLINGSGTSCLVEVRPANFALTIYSGTDRIWSSADCARAVTAKTRKVAAEDALDWTMAWDGRRSAQGCKARPEAPRAGTYVATAQLEGAAPVQLRMILRD